MATAHGSMAGGGFNGHTSQPSAFTSSQKDMKYVSPLALDHTALGDVSGKALEMPLALESSTSYCNSAGSAPHAGTASARCGICAKTCQCHASVLACGHGHLCLIVDRDQLVFYSVYVVGHPLFLC